MGEATLPLARIYQAAATLLFVAAILYLGRGVILPVVEALVVWFVLNAMTDGLRRFPGIGRRLPRWLALLASAVIVFVLAILVLASTVETVAGLGSRAVGLGAVLDPAIERLAAALGLESDALLARALDGLRIEALLREVVTGMLGLVSHVGVVAIYVVFLLVDQQFFEMKLRVLVPDPEQRARSRAIFERIAGSIKAYLFIMTVVSGLTASLSYAILLVTGVEHAFFLAATIFVLNFIPTVGSILGTALPAVFALTQFQALWPALVVLASVGLVQFVIGNILLPRLAGGSLNISLTVTILSLFAFGALWGVTGMFVAMPLTAMMIIVFSNFPATRPIAIIMSRTGEVDVPELPVLED